MTEMVHSDTAVGQGSSLVTKVALGLLCAASFAHGSDHYPTLRELLLTSDLVCFGQPGNYLPKEGATFLEVKVNSVLGATEDLGWVLLHLGNETNRTTVTVLLDREDRPRPSREENEHALLWGRDPFLLFLEHVPISPSLIPKGTRVRVTIPPNMSPISLDVPPMMVVSTASVYRVCVRHKGVVGLSSGREPAYGHLQAPFLESNFGTKDIVLLTNAVQELLVVLTRSKHVAADMSKLSTNANPILANTAREWPRDAMTNRFKYSEVALPKGGAL